MKWWSKLKKNLMIQQQQFCQLTDRFYDNLNKARKSKNEIKVNIVHKERQDDLDALIPGGKMNNWIFKVADLLGLDRAVLLQADVEIVSKDCLDVLFDEKWKENDIPFWPQEPRKMWDTQPDNLGGCFNLGQFFSFNPNYLLSNNLLVDENYVVTHFDDADLMRRMLHVGTKVHNQLLNYEHIDIVPGPDEVLIQQKAIGLNFIDTYHRSGLYPLDLPSGIGGEGLDIVVEDCLTISFQLAEDVFGCTESITLSINNPLPISIDSVVTSNVNCHGTSDGFVNVYASGGTLPYIFNWNGVNPNNLFAPSV
mgnify:CR=1 FL=1